MTWFGHGSDLLGQKEWLTVAGIFALALVIGSIYQMSSCYHAWSADPLHALLGLDVLA
jgi:hypothetical protein